MSWFNLSAPTQITSCITMNGDRYNSEVAMIIEHSICSSRVTEVAGVSPLILADVNFRSKARLITIISYFTYIRLAAPAFAEQLQDAIKAARKVPAEPLILAYLLDLRSLIFFAIPVVRNDSHCININDNGFLLWCECHVREGRHCSIHSARDTML